MNIFILVAANVLGIALFVIIVRALAAGISPVLTAFSARVLRRKPPAKFLGVTSIAVALFLLIFLPIKGCNYWQVSLYKDAIPPQFELTETIYNDEESGFREGCGTAVFRLSEKTLARIRTEGQSYFESARLGRDGTSYHQYQEWKATPSNAKDRLFRGCSSGEPEVLKLAHSFLAKEGAFYTTGHEQDLIVVPSLGILVFSYNG